MLVTRVWHNAEPFHVELAEVRLADGTLAASGIAIGTEPLDYRLEYELTTTREYVTMRLDVNSRGSGWQRRLVLVREAAGAWSCTGEQSGQLDLPPPGGDLSGIQAALDCDLGLSPLTNTMPVLRHQLHVTPSAEPIEFLMAWVAVPELAVQASRQRYTHLRRTPAGAVVRFESLDNDFRADLSFDDNGLVLDYPGIGRAVQGRG
jgi:hypothetical protein